MVNYKSGGRRKITVNGITFNVPAGAVLIHLLEQVALATAADGMLKDNAIYQVTSGKTFFIKKIIVHTNSTGGGTLVVHQGDTENAQTALKVTIPLSSGAIAVTEYLYDNSFSSAKFITIAPSAAVVDYVEMIGYEL